MRKVLLTSIALALAGCTSTPEATKKAEEKAAPKKATKAPEKFNVKFETSKGDIVMEVVREWAPRGADRFHELVQDGFFDGSRFFRVRPKFVVQFGINKDPKISELWRQMKLPDDPVKQKNTRGFVSYAKDGPGSRTTQIFINLADNSKRLDHAGFAPFARVVTGIDAVDKLYATYGEMQSLGGGGPDPQKIEGLGEEYLQRSYPRLDKIVKATVTEP
jgi:peptidyl-prolyl cis-trans isomerase A (cyclophilin A)